MGGRGALLIRKSRSAWHRRLVATSSVIGDTREEETTFPHSTSSYSSSSLSSPSGFPPFHYFPMILPLSQYDIIMMLFYFFKKTFLL